MIKTISILAPPIRFDLDPFLLDPLLGMKRRLDNELIPRSKKKIREQDGGKRREFDKLLKEFEEVYERKKDEEVVYKARIKKAIEKRPHISATGRTVQFKRFQGKE